MKFLVNKIKLKNRIYECKICNQKFIPNSGVQNYCSNKCGIVARIARDKISCHDMTKRDRKNELWRNFYRKQKGYEPIRVIKCYICKKRFIRNSIDQKYCSNKECRLKFLANKGKEKYYKNKEKILNNRKNNVEYCILNRIRSRIRDALKSEGVNKSIRTIDMIGCTIIEYKQNLERQFEPGMNWKNNTVYGWHIDHKKSKKYFDLTKEEEQKKFFHFSNTQPLWARENLQKSGK
jgi:hypothetical protein